MAATTQSSAALASMWRTHLSDKFRYKDENWTDEDWRLFLEHLINKRLFSWKNVATLTIGQINPPQVGTSLASAEGFKQRYGKGNTMSAVMEWFYTKGSQCIDCGSWFELQADHIIPKEIICDTGLQLSNAVDQSPTNQRYTLKEAIRTELNRNRDQNKISERLIDTFADEIVQILSESITETELSKRLAYVADHLDNMGMRCRRCNVIRRPSHQFGGNTHLTAESALMWILFSFKPRTFHDYVLMCRLYGMTMADIRMQEGWAMAHWLQRADDGRYEMDDDRACSILLWPDNAITRSWPGDLISGSHDILYNDRLPNEDLCVIVSEHSNNIYQVTAFRFPINKIPFSHYFNGSDPPQTLAITYSAPKGNGDDKNGPVIAPMPPRNMSLLAHTVVEQTRDIKVSFSKNYGTKHLNVKSGSRRKKLLDCNNNPQKHDVTITVED
jgi:hypothetical protein